MLGERSRARRKKQIAPSQERKELRRDPEPELIKTRPLELLYRLAALAFDLRLEGGAGLVELVHDAVYITYEI